MLANVGMAPRVPPHPLPDGARGLTECVDSICRPDKAFTPHPANNDTHCSVPQWVSHDRTALLLAKLFCEL